ncbi:cell division protein FtsZ [Methanococcoides sp. NM1]|uniref:cell division protein FtsZ n=1 Tax=Methanococcoides sp. NM1 TaxID=1201013 RepID=UPI001083C758|nr:cell division protein FtsZ [Methanococcoides sp. NM1]
MSEELRNNDEREVLNGDVLFHKTRMVIVGCGGAGNTTLNRLYGMGMDDVKTIAINTDKQHLDITCADEKILIGKTLTFGMGAGGNPEIGRRAAEMELSRLESIFEENDIVFITAGLGGGIGTGVAPVIAEIVKKKGAIAIGLLSLPFTVERERFLKANNGMEKFIQVADTAIVLDNNRLLEYVPNLPIDDAFSVMDQIISEIVKGIIDTIIQPSLINIDYADFRSIMQNSGVSVVFIGESSGYDKSDDLVREVQEHPLLDVDYSNATAGLIQVTCGPEMSLKEIEKIVSLLTYELSSSANVIWGARIRDDYDGKTRVMAIMTGI